MKSYVVKLRDQEENNKLGYLIRKTEITTGGKSIGGIVKIPHYLNKRLGVTSQINEVVITFTLKDIEDIDEHNNQRDNFINERVKGEMSKNKINVVFVRISRSDGSGFSDLKKNIDKISEFVLDIIYSQPMVDIVTLPHVEFLKNDLPDTLVEFDNLIGERISEMASFGEGSGKIAYFLPSYYTRDGIPKLIDSYVSRFGADAIYICDFDGGTFSGIGYSLVSQISRKLQKDIGSESYSLYVYSQKERKRSGDEVLSEDLLALMNQVSIVGPSHKRLILPKGVIEEIKKKQEFNPKIFNQSDFLYYPYAKVPTANEFETWIDGVSGETKTLALEHKKRLADVYNAKQTQTAIEQVINEPEKTVTALVREEFKDGLKQINSRMRKMH